MKELSIEEKAKRYDEAIEQLRAMMPNWENLSYNGKTFLQDLVHIIPELKEGEDGKIRKRIIALINAHGQGMYKDEMLTWLEKQGNLMKALQISNAKIGELVEKNYYLKEQFEKQGNNMGISEATKQKLEDNLNKALEKETPESWNEFLEKQGDQKTIKKHNACEFCEDRYGCVSPCSMKLIEKEKPVDKVEPKFKVGDKIKFAKEPKYPAREIIAIQNDAYYFDEVVYLPFNRQDEWELVEQKSVIKMKTPEESLGIDSDTYNKIVDECIYGEQKPDAWSEEDVAMLDSAIAFVEHSAFTTIGKGKGGVVAWLKSLKDRVQPQKQEWSDVDKDILFRTINNLKFLRDTISIDPKYAINIIDIEREITWLNSLRPQNKTYYWTENEIKFAISDFIRGAESYEKMVEKLRCLYPQTTWKPSEGQLECLGYAIEKAEKDWSPLINNRIYLTLKALKEQLLELRESKV